LVKLCLAGTASDSIKSTQATRDLSSSNRVQALKNPNPLKVDGRLDVLVVAELSLDRIWGRFYVLNPLLIESKA